MRRLSGWLVTFVIGISASVCAQPSSTQPATNVLYATALQASISEMAKQWGPINDSYDNRLRTNYENLIVVAQPEITDGLPTDFGSHHVQYLDWRGLHKSYRGVHKEFSVLEIGAARSDGRTITIQINQSWYSESNGHSRVGISDWSIVTFEFDCAQQKFVVKSVQLGGI